MRAGCRLRAMLTLLSLLVLTAVGQMADSSAGDRVALDDPLYLDPSYYDAYYGYWTDMEAPAAETLA